MNKLHRLSLVLAFREHEMKVVIAGLIVVFVLFCAPQRARAAPEIFLPPTDRPIADPYRPPDGPYGAGNRGIEYRTETGDRITAAATGEVVFAGPVAGALFVTVVHPSGLRSTYGYLESMTVRVGARVRRGSLIGRALPGFHFTVRDGDTYLDPAAFFGEVRVRVRLVSTDSTGRVHENPVSMAPLSIGPVEQQAPRRGEAVHPLTGAVGFRAGPVS